MMLITFVFVVVVLVADAVAVFDGEGAEAETHRKRESYTPMQCSSSSGPYSYDRTAANGPKNWPKLAECCNGRLQSPIDMIKSTAKCRSFKLEHSSSPEGRLSGKVYNSGHAAKVQFKLKKKVTLTGVPFSKSDYILSELHIHVGNSTPGSGSEHRIDGKGYAGELHIIHYKKEYGSVAGALTKPDGLVVIGVFLKKSDESPNEELNRLINRISELGSEIGEKISISLDPRELVPKKMKFYTYKGSLTTPPCSESVRWIVMKKPMKITAKQLKVLKNLPTDKGDATSKYTNVRPQFPQGERKLLKNFGC